MPGLGVASPPSPAPLTFLSFRCCTMRAFLGAITRPGKTRDMRPGSPGPTSLPAPRPRFSPPFLGPRIRSEAAAAVLLFAGFCAWNLRCPCAMIGHAPEEAGPRPHGAGRGGATATRSRKAHGTMGYSGAGGRKDSRDVAWHSGSCQWYHSAISSKSVKGERLLGAYALHKRNTILCSLYMKARIRVRPGEAWKM